MGASPQGRRTHRASTAELRAPAPGTTAAAAGKLPTVRAVLAAACTTAGLDGSPPTMADLTGLLTQLHHISLPHLPAAELLGWDPVPDLRRRIAAAEDTGPDQPHFPRERCDEAAEKLAGLRYRLPRAVIHGDARLGNLIASPQGPVLCDLDTTSIGPPEWDLVPAAVAALRFPDRRDEHRQPPAAHLPRRR